jgi:hypothetical protein
VDVDLSKTYVAKGFHPNDKFYEIENEFIDKPFRFREGVRPYYKGKSWLSGWVDFVEGGSTYFLAVEVEEYDG